MTAWGITRRACNVILVVVGGIFFGAVFVVGALPAYAMMAIVCLVGLITWPLDKAYRALFRRKRDEQPPSPPPPTLQ